MIFAQWRARRANRILIDQLHGKIVAASRRPALYMDFAVPDSYEGRFEMVTLHAGLAMRRLAKISPVGVELAQELADSVFRHFDIALREMGVSDVGVPKRIKRMAEAFYGRNKAYGEGLDAEAPDRLVEALARNVYGAADPATAPQARLLARFVRAAVEALDQVPLEIFARGEIAFPEPGALLAKAEASHG
jgi:cytochrome b pre-mRNA-processing protein 3